METWLKCVLAVLATWRVTHLVVHEDGPFDFILRIRAAAGSTWIGKLMDCFLCFSVWVAAVAGVWLASNPAEFVAFWLAVSGAACLIEQLRVGDGPPHGGPPLNG
ncbi:MAG TPA: DUF1360 domain-containing protein [Burkholderiaceae bacterium]|nr:DUF1360 domain-containing protein [Burkholderiaceae bacterium]